MKNIVTIDFDIIMAPSIGIYNNMVGPNKWEEEFMDNHQLALSQADMRHYQELTQYLLNIVPQLRPDQIHFIQDHEHVIDFVPRDEDMVVTNIDHHHDLGYSESDFHEGITLENLTCGNWVKYLENTGRLIRYHWINNGNSTSLDEKSNVQHALTDAIDLRDHNLMSIGLPDQLIICLSPLWVPPNYRNLFFLWMDLCNFLHNTHYDFEG